MAASIDNRRRHYTLLQVGNTTLTKQLAGWDEQAYRELLQRHGATEKSGRISASTMSLAQLMQAVDAMKVLGFKPKAKSAKAQPVNNWRAPRIAKLNAIWCAMADAGVVRNRSEQAMRSWCENQIKGLTKFDWITSIQLNQAVEMMKSMAKNHGVELQQ